MKVPENSANDLGSELIIGQCPGNGVIIMKKKIINTVVCSAMGACVLMMSTGCATGGAAETEKEMKNVGVSMTNAVETVRLSDKTENPYAVVEENKGDIETGINDNGCEETTAMSETAAEPAQRSIKDAARPAELSDEEIGAIGSKRFEDTFGKQEKDSKDEQKTKLQEKVFDKLKGDNVHFAIMEYAKNDSYCGYCLSSDQCQAPASAARAEFQRQGDRQSITIEYDFGDDSYSDTMIIKDGKMYELDNTDKTYYIDELDMDSFDVNYFVGEIEEYFTFVPSLAGTVEIKGEPVAYEVYDGYDSRFAVYFLTENYCKVEVYDSISGLLSGYETITLDMPINEALFEVPADYTLDDCLSPDVDDDDDDDYDGDDYDICDGIYGDAEYGQKWEDFNYGGYNWNDLYNNGDTDWEALSEYDGYDWSELYDQLRKEGYDLNALYPQFYKDGKLDLNGLYEYFCQGNGYQSGGFDYDSLFFDDDDDEQNEGDADGSDTEEDHIRNRDAVKDPFSMK